jgi:hypothetical protein
MTETDAAPEADPAPIPPEPVHTVPEPPAAPSPVPAPERSARDVLPWLCAIGFVVLAGAIGFVGWSSVVREAQPPADVQALANRVAQLEQRSPPSQAVDLGPLEARVAELEQRQAPDLAPLEARVAALDQRTAPDLAPLEAKVAALEQRQVPDLAPLQARVAAMEQLVAGAGQLGARMDALSGQVAELAGRDRSAEGDIARRLGADEARLAVLEQSTAARLNELGRLARIAAAQGALAAGEPLGDLPGAPSALAHFASVNPPTVAGLRLSFTRAEQAALAAGQPDTGDKPFLAGVLTRAQDLITVRQGDRVLLGNPVAGVLARARAELDAGDLAGAVTAVGQLSGPAAAAMANWLADARALLAARAALADMAAQR